MKKEILEFFKSKDKKLFIFAKKFTKLEITSLPEEKYFESLIGSIVSQQISVQAANAIWSRLMLLIGNNPKPNDLLKISIEKLRETGVSNSKAQYIKNIALAFESKLIQPEKLTLLQDEDIINIMTQIKGIGRWTAEMFLIFTMARPDVFSLGDLGLKKGFKKIYGMKNDPSVNYLKRLTKKWSPYRSYASLILWKSLKLK